MPSFQQQRTFCRAFVNDMFDESSPISRRSIRNLKNPPHRNGLFIEEEAMLKPERVEFANPCVRFSSTVLSY